MYEDKISGTLIGLAVGDALGVPHEFKSQRNKIYTGKLEVVPEFIFRSGARTDVIGQFLNYKIEFLILCKVNFKNGS